MKSTKTIDEYISQSGEWEEALLLLRELMLDTRLEETVKWGAPVYALGKKNVVGLGAFKSYVGLWFYQGALLKDKAKKLQNAQEGVTKAMRQWRFQSADEIRTAAATIRTYIEEAIANQEAGKEIKATKNAPLVIPDELAAFLASDASLKAAFEALSLGKKRDYAAHIETAKRAETKQSRLEKIKPMILEGKGLNDKYLQ